MGLEEGGYVLQCWNSTTNPAEYDRPKLAYQSLLLVRALQKSFTHGEIALPSVDVKEGGRRIEICIMIREEQNMIEDFSSFLSATATNLGLNYRDFVKQEAKVRAYLHERELDTISALGKHVLDDITEEQVNELIHDSCFHEYNMTTEWRSSFSAQSQRKPPILISRKKMNALFTSEGQELMREIADVVNAFDLHFQKNKTGLQFISMAASGVLIAAPRLSQEGSRSGLPKSVVDRSIIFTLISATTPHLHETCHAQHDYNYSDAINMFLLVNHSPSDVLPMYEWIQHGERRSVPVSIPAAPPPDEGFVYCGVFHYSEYQIAGNASGFAGSAFGVSFKTDHGHFSIGMNCPDSIKFGKGSVEMHNREHAKDACEMALNSQTLHRFIDHPYVDAKIVHTGSINWGRAIVVIDNE